MSRIPQDISNRIAYLRYPLIVGVVWIHAFPSYVDLGTQSYGIAHPGVFFDTFREFVSNGFTRLAVPLLFWLSGYLFFWGMNPDKEAPKYMQAFLGKWKSRIRTLLIPFLFWNLFTMLVLTIGYLSPLRWWMYGLAYPPQFGIGEFLNALIGFTHPPIAYPFWFVRNLILLSLLSPILYLILRYAVWMLLPMASAWLFLFWPLRIPDSPGLLFFGIGAAMAIHQVNLKRLDSFRIPLTAIYLLLLANDVWHKGTHLSEMWHRAGILIGVMALWTWTARISPKSTLHKKLLWLAPTSFFLFAIHEPTLTLMRRFLFTWIQPCSGVSLFVLYLLLPLLLVFLSHFLYLYAQKRFPRPLEWVTGGR